MSAHLKPPSLSASHSSAESPSSAALVAAGAAGGVLVGGLVMHLYHRYASASLQHAPRASVRYAQELSVAPPSVPATPVINTARPGVFAPASPAFLPGSPRATPTAQSGSHGRRESVSFRGTPLCQAVVVVDPISTGANVAFEVTRKGYACIKVASGYVSPSLLNLVDATIRTDFVASIAHDSSDPYKTIVSLRGLPFDIIGAISGSELGIEVTDFITEALDIPTNGTELTNARRDKYQMGECVRRHGVRATKQARVQSWLEVQTFLSDLRPNPFRVIIKPIRSSGSDHVYLCSSEAELREHFDEILGQKNQLGFVNDAVVVQEFLDGKEYVVDSVSRRGKHKVVALWEYDKRKFAGFNFVYFGMGSVSGYSDVGRALCEYTVKVLDALNIVEGAGHGEVIITKDGPCLVEIGARCHGCEGTFMPLSDRCWGYNQVGALVAATVSQAEFDSLPDVCGDEREYGFKVDFVSNVSGTLERIDHLDLMEQLDSFVQFDLLPKPGDTMSVTIDCLPELDTRVLTDTGFLFLSEIEARLRRQEPVLYGCYDAATQCLVYSPGRLVSRTPPARWVDFTQAATRPMWDATSNDYGATAAGDDSSAQRVNYITVRTTPRHEMYVQLGQRIGSEESGGHMRMSDDMPTPPHKMTAEELAPGFACTCEENGVECTHGYSTYHLFTAAGAGILNADVMSINDTARDSPVVRLGLRSDDQVNAFLELYGYWLGNGAIRYDSATTGAVAISTKKQRDSHYLLDLIARLRLQRTEWYFNVNAAGCLVVNITAKRWLTYFDKEYGLKYAESKYYDTSVAIAKLGNGPQAQYRSQEPPAKTREDPEPEEDPTQPCKWFWSWVLTRLNKEQMGLVIEGLSQADGISARDKTSEMSRQRMICTSSVAFRDQLVQACLHAGYSAYFTVNTRAGSVLGYNTVPTDYRIYSQEEMEQLLQVEPSRVFKVVSARYDNWWVRYSAATSELLSAGDVRYDGKALQPREKMQFRQGFVAVHSDGRVVRAAIQRELAEAIGMTQSGVSTCLSRGYGRTRTGWQIYTAAAYEEQTDAMGMAPASTSATTEEADAYDLRDGRVWCVDVAHGDHLIFVQRAHRNAAGIVTKASRAVITGNCFTACGSVTLAHPDRRVVEADHLKVREWERSMFVVKKEAKQTKAAK